MAPAGKGFLLSFGEAEVHLRAPHLLDAVVFIGLEQFVGAQDAHRAVRLGRHGVLPALAAGQRQQRGAHAQAAAQIGQQRAVLVVRMGHDHHHAGGGPEASQALLQVRLAAVLA